MGIILDVIYTIHIVVTSITKSEIRGRKNLKNRSQRISLTKIFLKIVIKNQGIGPIGTSMPKSFFEQKHGLKIIIDSKKPKHTVILSNIGKLDHFFFLKN